MPLNREAANFESTVFEGFYELRKTVEISMRHPGEVYVYQTAASETLSELRNRFAKRYD